MSRSEKLSGFECPACHVGKSAVTDSRRAPEFPDRLRRRRKCDNCGLRFTTYETTQSDDRHERALYDELRGILKRFEERTGIKSTDQEPAGP